MHKRVQGNTAEALALSWLEHQGYELIQANYLRRVGEIDLWVRHPDQRTVVFVEVRYRRLQDYGGALASVTPRKQQRLRRTAGLWLAQYGTDQTPARIDVIALCPASAQTPAERYWQGHDLCWVINAIED